jgi:hypothetical protein
MPVGEGDQIADQADREKAAKLIDDFVWAVKTVFEKADVAKNSHPADVDALQLCLTSLQRLLSAILRKLPPLFQLEALTPVRFRDLERTQDYARLLRDWEANHSRSHSIDRGPLAASLRASAGAGLRRSLAAVLVAHEAAAMKACPPHIRRAFRETVAGFVEFDAEEAAERSRGTAKRRWMELGRTLAEKLRSLGGKTL